MKLYLHEDGKTVCAFADDGSQDHLIGNKKPITEAQAQIYRQKTAEDEFESYDWYRKRIFTYPSIGDFIDAWVKNDQEALEKYRQDCLAVKAKYPKPEGF